MLARLRLIAVSHPLFMDSLMAVLLALLIGLGVIPYVRAGASTAEIVGRALFGAAALPLALRRRSPYLCLVATLALTALGHVMSDRFPPAVLPGVIALYSVGTVASGRKLTIVAVGTLALAVGLGFISRDEEDVARALVFEVAWVIGSLALGLAIANRRAYVEQMRQKALEAERTKEEEAQRRVNEERMRIARDVHDGVAHALASISLQASGGGTILDRDPEGARQAFKAIRSASGVALSELRSTLGLLRHEDDAHSVEGLDREEVQRLVAVLRAERIRVRVQGEADDWTLAGETGVALHRVLQESLTNVLRHSGATEVRVAIEREHGQISLTVADNGRGAATRSGESRGYGLLGMRERAALLGGTFESGTNLEGGFWVKATLPTEEGI